MPLRYPSIGRLLTSFPSSGGQNGGVKGKAKMARYIELRRHADSDGDMLTEDGVRAAVALGKVLGQLCVGLVMLTVYAGMGITALVSFAMLGLVDLSLLLVETLLANVFMRAK